MPGKLQVSCRKVQAGVVALSCYWPLQEAPPAPNNTAVWLYRNPQATLAVRMFQARACGWGKAQGSCKL